MDADIVGYRCGFTTMTEPVEIAKWRCNELIERILADTQATSYQLYLTASGDETAFRPMVYPEYKQNRKAPKPTHYNALREFMVEEWGAEIVSGIEADDALGIAQTEHSIFPRFGECAAAIEGAYLDGDSTFDSIICTIDKDLNMIPGMHYNFVKNNLLYVSREEAIYNFYKQVLMGDSVDNIKGIEGIGEKKACKILGSAEDEQTLFERTRNAYNNDEEFLRTAEVIWIMRKHQEPWSSTGFGSQLVPKAGLPWSFPWQHQPPSSESIGEEILTDGFQQNGIDLLDNGEVMVE